MVGLAYKMQDNMSSRPGWEADEVVYPCSSERPDRCLDSVFSDSGFCSLS